MTGEFPVSRNCTVPKGETRQWNSKGSKCYWTVCKVESIVRDEKYTEAMVLLTTKLDAASVKQVSCPKVERVCIENIHCRYLSAVH